MELGRDVRRNGAQLGRRAQRRGELPGKVGVRHPVAEADLAGVRVRVRVRVRITVRVRVRVRVRSRKRTVTRCKPRR